MQIMCLNGWGGTLHDKIVPYLSATQPDVLCLQEVVHTPDARKEWLTYRDGDHVLPQRARFFQEVCDALPNHRAIFCPAAQGALWDGDAPVASQWGLASFVRADIAIVAQVQGFVHKGFSADGFGDHPRSRSAHAMRLFDPASKRMVSVTQMHGLRDLAGKMDTPARAAQAERLMAMTRQVTEPGDLQIVCGDFNLLPGSATLALLAEHGLTELVQHHGFPGTRNSHYTKPQRYADYMFINDLAAVARFDVVYQPEVSDHCPLVLHL
ncbi:endonuclease/exonuclease/phosphatase family protein [Roseibaca sp. Y0-43]|uniref:endonuclease/exonuclease/phosphatase family protein n=1 Tax=Roseibaca sp. Y0-43 TaxID=2816854 RepID=UPI001D0C12E3|nr:endonuclease/exonuclease/phosphatase family protein [Roseibaca sp. Y0-43]MCC1482614.1 endonuclease/exonuclease/phosphatase family protein [Roseibaca sp. Y0-43]